MALDRTGRTARTISLALAATLLLSAIAAGPAMAAKGGPKALASGNSLTLVMVNDQNGDGKPNFGDTITWDVSTTATGAPNVGLVCTQNGTVVYRADSGYYDGYLWPWTQRMTLKSGAWAGGSAGCVAELFWYSGTRTVVGATVSFAVDG